MAIEEKNSDLSISVENIKSVYFQLKHFGTFLGSLYKSTSEKVPLFLISDTYHYWAKLKGYEKDLTAMDKKLLIDKNK